MSRIAERIAAEIRAHGAMAFSRFMELALYDAEDGYYRSGRKVFGVEGDFYTAAQLQPVFGRVLRNAFQQLVNSDGNGVTVVDWGAGQRDLATELTPFTYRAMDAGMSAPAPFEGIVFANELFDALPVDIAQRGVDGVWRDVRVALHGEQFVWENGAELTGAWLDYAQQCAREAGYVDGAFAIELPVAMQSTLERIDAALTRGWIVTLDYGYTRREMTRFTAGTLMGYARHRAHDDVLLQPGERDITAHVAFDELRRRAVALGWSEVRYESMGRFLLSAGERDQFASALTASTELEATKLRLQLKTLLFDLGEMFRAVVWRKA